MSKEKDQTTSIAIFGHARPTHMKRLLTSLESNPELSHFPIYIYIDRIKSKKYAADNALCVQIAEDFVSRHQNTKIHKHEVNFGLSGSIKYGVDDVFKTSNQVIVLEDDLICSNYFIDFCIQGLNRFREISKVASIHGYLPRLDTKFSEPQFFRGADCWGWATWKDRWESIEWDANKLIADITHSELEHIFDLGGKFPFFRMLQEQAEGKIDSWAIRWHASMFLQSKLTLYPNRSLVGNTGFDNSGTHGKKSNSYDTQICYEKIPIPNEINIEESELFRNAISNFYFSLTTGQEPLIYRLRKKVSSFVRRS